MTDYRITHTTTYAYGEPVALCQNLAHLTPRPSPYQRAEDSTLDITPEPAFLVDGSDYFGNPVTYFTIQERHAALVLRASHRMTVRSEKPRMDTTPAWEEVRERLRRERSAAWLDAYQFAFPSRFAAIGPAFAEYAAPAFTPGRSIRDASLELTRRIHADFVYDQKATTLATPVAEVLENRRGVCQDFAHVQLACLRSVGLAARYVSGYLSTAAPAGRPRLVGANATHAWVSVFCGESGWIDLDPTNDQIPADRHILLAWGRDYEDVSPLKGVILGGGRHEVKVSVDVAPVESEAGEAN
jgi:transglutaminase-like putative cysteine protease